MKDRKRFVVLAVMLGVAIPAFAEGFVSGTLFVGYTVATTSPAEKCGAAGLSANFVSNGGLLVTTEVYDRFHSDDDLKILAAAGFGYSFFLVPAFSLDAALLISSDLISASYYTMIGPRVGATYWLGDLGVTAQAAYYSQYQHDSYHYQLIAFRIGVSLGIKRKGRMSDR